ncbi:MAG: phosphate ABC transporter substrate-binding protein [Oleispira sp.]|nr:phosphate ABC transporter substrate-binding protein [Oleispira sp.]|tara:strand:- start:1455 stop:2498 length:1044 start_codon:yes stop_codon:yes gene_type:complete
MKKILALSAAFAASAISMSANAQRDYISIVGSSTVYPFSTVVAERFGKSTKFATPKVESTGSGGGLKLFCSGVGSATPDITNASRAIKSSEVKLCAKNGIKDIVEVKVGYDGIVLANTTEAKQISLTRRDIFLALAKNIPNPDGSETLVENTYETWNEVNPSLPKSKIEVLGPPPTSGTRDAFAELALEGGCKTFPFIKAMKKQNKKKYKAVCHAVREDGAYVEAGENDNLIVQKLVANPSAMGVFGYSFLEQNSEKVQGSVIDGKLPTFDAIASGDYPVSRSLFFYVKKAHIGVIPGIEEYLAEFTSEKAMGDYGYLAEKGMIPMTAEERNNVLKTVKNLTPLVKK